MDEAGTRTGVWLLRDGDTDYAPVTDGIAACRVINMAGVTQLGGGFTAFEAAGLDGWTLPYDEVFYVISGRLAVTVDGESKTAGPGEVLLLSKGTTASYYGEAGTKAFYVLYPHDWDKQA